MIKEIHMDKVACYKAETKICPKNKITLVYGLNGSGKSTVSNFLYSPEKQDYICCRILEDSESEILVYNQHFIRDYFYEEDSLSGIFTLSKENKNILTKIEEHKKLLNDLFQEHQNIDKNQSKIKNDINTNEEQAIEQIWELKKRYTGGDRVLEYCFTGLKVKKNLFPHILSVKCPTDQPADTIISLKNEISALQGENAHEISPLSLITFNGLKVEKDQIFKESIVGKTEGNVAEFINRIGNSDWVKTGLSFLSESGETCPFCQEKTLTEKVVKSLQDVFDDTYELGINRILSLKQRYDDEYLKLQRPDLSNNIVVTTEIQKKWKALIDKFESNIRENKLLIENKLKQPSQIIKLQTNDTVIDELNTIINQINSLVSIHNEKLDKKEDSLESIKNRFWSLMRYHYDQTIQLYTKKSDKLNIEHAQLIKDLIDCDKKIFEQKQNIITLQRQTVNIDDAIENINNKLKEMGVFDFSVIKHQRNLYRICRNGSEENVFQSLSEGEKTVISFLYFLEMCIGHRTANSSPRNKIVIVDDPISSLSHIYVFNIGQLIKRILFNSNQIHQVILFTHSLYFFYELTHTNKEKRNELQELYRIVKNSNGSQIVPMRYEEIQNDYQSYWSIIKDQSNPPALIANCMRNIIEYFFSFVKKSNFNNVFQHKSLSGDKYQAFARYMNRESHSLGQNIFDIKEFDYQSFVDGLKLIFQESGYPDHYKAMMK